MLDELMKKHKKTQMDPATMKAKMGVLNDISDMASDSMGGDLKGMKKVSVAAPDSAGLHEGLDLAKNIVDDHANQDDAKGPSATSDEEEHGEGTTDWEGHANPESDMNDDETSDKGDDGEDSENAEPGLSEHAGNHPGSAENMLQDQIDHETEEGDLTAEEIEDLIQDLMQKKAALGK